MREGRGSSDGYIQKAWTSYTALGPAWRGLYDLTLNDSFFCFLVGRGVNVSMLQGHGPVAERRRDVGKKLYYLLGIIR